MGIDYTSLEAILLSQKYLIKKNKMLTLGKQHIHIDKSTFDSILYKNGIVSSNFYSPNSETMFEKLGFFKIDSLDYSSYEGATIVHDMNIKTNITQKYDYIYDGGTIEHIFNTPQVLDNIINLLDVDGVFCSVTCNNNLSGHGFYQFSPELFLSSFTQKYGMELLSLKIAKVGSGSESWIDVMYYGSDGTGRNTSRFDSTNMVYIITIARKVSNDRASLIYDPPQQYSYNKIDWKK
jgi:hypothetical protein